MHILNNAKCGAVSVCEATGVVVHGDRSVANDVGSGLGEVDLSYQILDLWNVSGLDKTTPIKSAFS